jgi:protein TonB
MGAPPQHVVEWTAPDLISLAPNLPLAREAAGVPRAVRPQATEHEARALAKVVAPDERQTVSEPSFSATRSLPARASELPSSTPRFVLTAPTGATRAASAALSSGGVAQPTRGAEPPISAEAADVPARLLTGSAPSYTPAARAAGVEANLALEIVVDRSGRVVTARGLAHVGYGLDEAALAAVRNYIFAPARRAGTAVAVRMRWLMRFELH